MASSEEQRITGGGLQVGPILLFGMPRSGTTWIGKLFDSHPDSLYRHEPDSWQKLDMPRYPDSADAVRHGDAIRTFVADLPDIRAQRVAGKQPLFPKNYLSRSQSLMMSAGVGFARLVSQVYPDFPVLMHRSGRAESGRRVVWKSIESLARLGVILQAVEQARAIQILRHPCGYIASVQRGLDAQKFSDNTSTSEDYGIFSAVVDTPLGDRYGLSMQAMQALTAEERLAWHWAMVNEKAWLESEKGGRRLCIRYEDICGDPMAGVQKMFDFVGLPLEAQTRSFVNASTRDHSEAYYSVFKNPERAAWRWREEMDTATIERIRVIIQRTRIGEYYAAENDWRLPVVQLG